MILIIIFDVTIIDGFTFGIDSYDIYHHLSTPSLPLMIEIIISVNDGNDGRPLNIKMLSHRLTLFNGIALFPIYSNFLSLFKGLIKYLAV